MGATPQRSMHAAASTFYLLLIVLTIGTTTNSSVCAQVTNGGGCVEVERAALLSFKAGITGDPGRLLDSWRGHDCCKWYGVRCSRRTGHVVKLNLSNTVFSPDDPFPYSLAHHEHVLGGQISSSLLALQHLEYLDLSGNSLGKLIPEFLGSLKGLVHLNLACMDFHGRIPPQLGNLSTLLYLDMNAWSCSSNSKAFSSDPFLFDRPYSSDLSWLPRLSSLEHLDMSGVNISSIPNWVPLVNMLPNLRVLRLGTCGITSSIPSLLHSNLTSLEILDLSGNILDGQVAKNWFWEVTSLKNLNLMFCDLSGQLPDELGNLTKLERLYMTNNYIQGIPSTLDKLCSLKFIDFNANNINGDITDFMERIPRCARNKLMEFDLAHNNVTGNLPSWVGNLTCLTSLMLSFNQITGSVPAGIGALTNLTSLELDNNKLIGVISEDHFAHLSSLELIDLSYNQLKIVIDSNWIPPFRLWFANFASCQMGPEFPTWLKWQKDALSIDISRAGLVGIIPSWFWTVFSSAHDLDISYNQFSGELPLNLEFMSAQELYLNANQFIGSVPQLPKSLQILDISNNSLHQPLSSNIGAPKLEVIILFSNYINGSIRISICRWEHLRVVDLSSNLLVGGLPSCGTDMEQQSTSGTKSSTVNSNPSSLGIEVLLLSNNSLSGDFPLFLQGCENLTILDLSYNKFSGCLPSWIGEMLPSLVFMQLRSNMFVGHIPVQMTKLENLRYLDMANNYISGSIPQYLGNLKGMVVQANTYTIPWAFIIFSGSFHENGGYYRNFRGLDDTLSTVTKGQGRKYSRGIEYMVSIDISCNNLTGQIPEEIGSLAQLINLNLSYNLLNGNIPDKIGLLQLLESLDLSNNQISGEIPSSLSNLTFLSYLNLSNNNLSGRIPSGYQLDTLDTDDPASMYVGNAGLCGHPLPNNCSGDKPAQVDHKRVYRNISDRMYFHLGLIMGFLVGLWMVFCSFLFKRTWRVAYFCLIDQLHDRFMYLFLLLGLGHLVQENK